MYSCFAIRHRCSVLRVLAAGLCASLVVPGLSAQSRPDVIAGLQPVRQADRIAANPDYGPLVALGEKLPGWVRGGSQMSGHGFGSGAPLHVSVILRRDAAAQAAFDQLLANQQNPDSPYYHQWLTPQQVGQLYGPTADDLAAVSSWLTSQGLKVDSIAPSGVIVRCIGHDGGRGQCVSYQLWDVCGCWTTAAFG